MPRDMNKLVQLKTRLPNVPMSAPNIVRIVAEIRGKIRIKLNIIRTLKPK
jgi:hypothetical protein